MFNREFQMKIRPPSLLPLLMAVTLVFGCVAPHSKHRAEIPGPPPDPLPTPPTVQQINAQIQAHQNELEQMLNTPKDNTQSAQSLDLEATERGTRVRFLRAEIKALIEQRNASEIYYRQTGGLAGLSGSVTASIGSTPATSPPPSVAAVDAGIRLRRSWIRFLIPMPNGEPSAGPEDEAARLREIQERETRIAFLKGEIEALILQRKASEIYYRQATISPHP